MASRTMDYSMSLKEFSITQISVTVKETPVNDDFANAIQNIVCSWFNGFKRAASYAPMMDSHCCLSVGYSVYRESCINTDSFEAIEKLLPEVLTAAYPGYTYEVYPSIIIQPIKDEKVTKPIRGILEISIRAKSNALMEEPETEEDEENVTPVIEFTFGNTISQLSSIDDIKARVTRSILSLPASRIMDSGYVAIIVNDALTKISNKTGISFTTGSIEPTENPKGWKIHID